MNTFTANTVSLGILAANAIILLVFTKVILERFKSRLIKYVLDNEIDRLDEKIKLSSNETEIVTDNELTRELMEKYVESVICEGSIVQKIIWK